MVKVEQKTQSAPMMNYDNLQYILACEPPWYHSPRGVNRSHCSPHLSFTPLEISSNLHCNASDRAANPPQAMSLACGQFLIIPE